MYLPRWFYWLSTAVLLTVCSMLAYGWMLSYRFAQKQWEAQIDDSVQAAAKRIQDYNYTCYDLLKAENDKEYKEKIAFAAGITQNRASVAISFDSTKAAQPAVKKEDSVKITIYTDKGPVLKSFAKKNLTISASMHGNTRSFSFTTNPAVNHRTDTSRNMLVRPVKTTVALDSVLHATLTDGMHISYQLQRQQVGKSIPGPCTRPFIIDFFAPDVYVVGYTLPVTQVIVNTIPYIIVAVVVLLLILGAFLLYGKSYIAQKQVAEFREAMFSNVTHELKTPMASIQLVVDALNAPASGLSAQQQQQVSFAARELTRMELLIEKILSFGKLNKKQLALTKELVDIGALVNEAAAILSVALNDREGHLEVSLPPTPVIAKGDRILLLNMLVSIIDNAVKYTEVEPRIKVSLSAADNTIITRITDNGPGIDIHLHEKVFEPFFRLQTGNIHNVKGHGLGLSFARQVAALHNGSITLQSHGGKGSTFIITLPY